MDVGTRKISYEESIKSSIKFCNSNPDIIECDFGHYNNILTKEEQAVLNYQKLNEYLNPRK